jgi:hypothetical protein
MREVSLLLLLVASACAERRVSAVWSLPPRDNLLARILEQPMDERWLTVRLNSAIAALHAAALQRGSPQRCDQAPFTGCEYEVRLAALLGNRLDCSRNAYRIVESKEGQPVVTIAQHTPFACPPSEGQ